jgi:serine/threonine protein kinase
MSYSEISKQNKQSNNMISNSNGQKDSKDLLWKSIANEYHLQEVLGEGSFGQVLKATHKKTGVKVAIKLVLNAF